MLLPLTACASKSNVSFMNDAYSLRPIAAISMCTIIFWMALQWKHRYLCVYCVVVGEVKCKLRAVLYCGGPLKREEKRKRVGEWGALRIWCLRSFRKSALPLLTLHQPPWFRLCGNERWQEARRLGTAASYNLRQFSWAQFISTRIKFQSFCVISFNWPEPWFGFSASEKGCNSK